MNTRSKRGNGVLEAGRDRDDKYDTLIRPSIRNPKRSNSKVAETDDDDGNKTKTIQNKMVAGFGEKTQIRARVGVASKSRNKNNPSSSKPAAANAIIRDNDSNHSGKESDDEDESSEEGLEPASNIPKRFLKGEEYQPQTSTRDNFHEQGDQHRPLSLRLRKDVSEPRDIKPNRYDSIEKKEFSHKQTPKKAKARELDRYNAAAYSDGEEYQPQTSTSGAENQPKPQTVRGNLWLMSFALIVIVLGIWILVLKNPSTPSAEEKQLQVMKSFQDNFRKLPILFSGQSSDLWHRSQRILELQLRHVNENEEPAIILLTAAQDAKQMLYCVGNHLAKTYASALNSSYTVLSGTDMPSEDSEDVKMDIDHRLNAGFQGNSKAAVLHHLELLPPGSLIILYKYCDHENAAFKNVALVLTVLLKDPTLHKDIGLNELEETVYDFLKETFVNQAKSKTSHNEMDGDKLGGVWSRISHVVLPVFPGKQIVKECEDFKASP